MRYLPDNKDNETALRFDALLADIMASAEKLLPTAEWEAFRAYDFPGRDRANLPVRNWQRRLRSMMRGEEWLLRHVREEGCRTFVDLGCGLGTWSFLAALAGAEKVLGIDLCRSRLNAARILADRVFPRHGTAEIRFLCRSIFKVVFDGPVDVFYLKASVHHILPVTKLFDYLYENLRPGGVVVIHDSNGANPYSLYLSVRARGFRTREAAADPDTGEDMPYASEDLFTLPGIVRRCRRHGFNIIYRQAYLGFRGRADDRWWYRMITRLNQNLILGTLLAPTYQVAARKPS